MGKVNIIDLSVLIVIVLIIGVAGYRFGGSKVKSVFAESVQKKDVTFTVKCTVRKEAIAKSMHHSTF